MSSFIRDINNSVRSEVELLQSQDIINSDSKKKILSHYPPGKWNIIVLIRFFTLLGIISTGIGLFLIIQEFVNLYMILEIVLPIAIISLFFLGRWLEKKKDMERTGAALHLLMCFAFSGLTFTLGLHFSTGSGNWPALVGIDFVIFIILAYLLNNRLILILSCIYFFVWFGGQTGYISGWGAYFLGMNYPLRFFIAGAFSTLIGALHLYSNAPVIKRFTNFNRVYFHFGLLIINLSLWFFALFGYFENNITWSNNTGERIAFTLLWFAASGGAIFYGLRKNNGIFRSHGLVFFIINLYTFYFQFIAANSGSLWFIHTLLIGGSLIALGVYIEKWRKGVRGGEGKV